MISKVTFFLGMDMEKTKRQELRVYFPNVIMEIISQFLLYTTFVITDGRHNHPMWIYPWGQSCDPSLGTMRFPPRIPSGKMECSFSFIYRSRLTFLYMIYTGENQSDFHMQDVDSVNSSYLFSLSCSCASIRALYEMDNMLFLFLTTYNSILDRVKERTLFLRYSFVSSSLLPPLDDNDSVTCPGFNFKDSLVAGPCPTSCTLLPGLRCFTRAQDSLNTLYLLYGCDSIRLLVVWIKDIGKKCIPIYLHHSMDWSSMCAVNVNSKLYLFTRYCLYTLERFGDAQDISAHWRQEPNRLVPEPFSKPLGTDEEGSKLVAIVHGLQISFILGMDVYTYDTLTNQWDISIGKGLGIKSYHVVSDQEGGCPLSNASDFDG
jgi:hypothetical protein